MGLQGTCVQAHSYLYDSIHGVATWVKGFVIYCSPREQLLKSTVLPHPHTCGVVLTAKVLSSAVRYLIHQYLHRMYRALSLAVLHVFKNMHKTPQSTCTAQRTSKVLSGLSKKLSQCMTNRCLQIWHSQLSIEYYSHIAHTAFDPLTTCFHLVQENRRSLLQRNKTQLRMKEMLANRRTM